jgi:diguanylate cyclase (GGDEF)-like protein
MKTSVIVDERVSHLKHVSLNQTSRDNRNETAYFPLEFFDELSKARTLGEILQSTSYWINQIFQSDRVSIALQIDPEFLSILAISGSRVVSLEQQVPIENTLIGKAYCSKKIVICQDTSSETLLDCQWLFKAGLLSCINVPLINGDMCFGALNVGHHEKHHFDEHDAHVLSSIVNWIASQISVQKQILKMESLANIDMLTGVLNRRAFMEATKLIDEKPRVFEKNHALMMFDIDHFKLVNDEHGHLGGDEVLIALAKLIQSMKRKNDLFARIGGEEFVLLLSNISQESAIDLAERYRQSIEDMVVDYNDKQLRCTVSIGISIPLETDSSYRDVLSRADIALYSAKNSGRNQVQCWNKDMQH